MCACAYVSVCVCVCFAFVRVRCVDLNIVQKDVLIYLDDLAQKTTTMHMYNIRGEKERGEPRAHTSFLLHQNSASVSLVEREISGIHLREVCEIVEEIRLRISI